MAAIVVKPKPAGLNFGDPHLIEQDTGQSFEDSAFLMPQAVQQSRGTQRMNNSHSDGTGFLPPLRNNTVTALSRGNPATSGGVVPMDTSSSVNQKVSNSVTTMSASSDAPSLRKPSKSPSAESLQSAASSGSNGGSGGSGGTRGYSPEEAVRTFGQKLSSFEHTEIYNYPNVYFVGSQAKKRSGMVGAANNNGYDDENGSYLLVAHDHVAYRYEILKVIGKGSFGQVIKAYDHKKQQYVALKLVRNEKRFHRQAEEEIRILDHLRKQDRDGAHNCVQMLDHFNFRNHKCISFELLRNAHCVNRSHV